MTLTYNGHSLPTEYRGTTFRSRLEARWAVFFDQMNIHYLYEPTTINTDRGWYLPDFYLPQFETFWIVKGEGIDAEEEHKVDWLAKQSYGAVIAIGEIPHNTDGALNSSQFRIYGWVRHYRKVDEPFNWDGPVFFGKCKYCGKIELTFECRIGRLCNRQSNDLLHPRIDFDPKMYWNCDTDDVDAALYMAATQQFNKPITPLDAA